ncbi:ABC transporter permease [Reichenbachiella versicolor]|uniref:ABC transporter permease n=1 Tax=Reichenbachiella versicolor TaxID=1821036 RepID=UPI000D6E455E|nr:FtsX-like permease family protein [Reichenbachiella versicolor]
MNFSLFISRRYFFSKKKKNFINVIAIVSMVVVSLASAALIIGLSVFNGMENLLKSIYGEFDAAIQITPSIGKSMKLSPELKSNILKIDGIEDIVEVIEDNAFLKYNNSQKIVKVKGVSQNFIDQKRLKSAIREGVYELDNGEEPRAIIGRGIQYKLGIMMKNEFTALQFFYPKSGNPSRSAPYKMYNRANIMPGASFALEQTYDDNYIFVPISFAERLFSYKDKRTSLELIIPNKSDIPRIQNQLIKEIGESYTVLNAEQQHASLYKALKIEKLFVFIFLMMVIGLASINIFFSLSMLVIEKKKDIHILSAMGASSGLIRKIFLSEGLIIAFVGAGSGLLLGLTIAWLQQTFGFISMNVSSAVMPAYPVKIMASDFGFTAISIILITFLTSIQPANRASKLAITQ